MTDSVVCCFCGQSLMFSEAATMIVQPNPEVAESQQLFCHRSCLIGAVDDAIVLHPDFYDEESPS